MDLVGGILEKISSISSIAGNTLYYPGCLTKYVAKELEENYKNILKKAGIDFLVLQDEFCCGSPVANAGYKEDFDKLIEKNREIFKKHAIKKIITSCPACFSIISKNYRDIEAEYAAVIIAKAIRKGRLKPKKTFNGTAAFHDPCHLGRYSGIYEEPRLILKSLGFDITELPHSREQSLCCGAGGGVRTNNPEVADKSALRVLEEAKLAGAKKIISSCPLCFLHLKNVSEKNGYDMTVQEISQVLIDAV